MTQPCRLRRPWHATTSFQLPWLCPPASKMWRVSLLGKVPRSCWVCASTCCCSASSASFEKAKDEYKCYALVCMPYSNAGSRFSVTALHELPTTRGVHVGISVALPPSRTVTCHCCCCWPGWLDVKDIIKAFLACEQGSSSSSRNSRSVLVSQCNSISLSVQQHFTTRH